MGIYYREHDQVFDMEWRNGVRSEYFLCGSREADRYFRKYKQNHGPSMALQQELGCPHETSRMLTCASCSPTQVALLTTSQIFNASHMVPYDVPDIAHDMILRFMGMNFSAIADGSARIPSTVGDDAKPIFLDSGDIPLSSPSPGNMPEQSKAQWDGEPSLWYDN
jgi:hypothetical protein